MMNSTLDRETTSEVVLRFIDSTPIDLYGLAKALGVDVRYDGSLPRDVSGAIERAPGGRHRITINSRHSPRRQRFTLAHEIGHYVLHRDLIGDGLTDDRLYRSTLRGGGRLDHRLEVQANRYAADLLMPVKAVRAKYLGGVRTAEGIAEAFDVSTEAAQIRLRELGLR